MGGWPGMAGLEFCRLPDSYKMISFLTLICLLHRDSEDRVTYKMNCGHRIISFCPKCIL